MYYCTLTLSQSAVSKIFGCEACALAEPGFGVKAIGKENREVHERGLPSRGRMPAFLDVPECQIQELHRRLVARENDSGT